MRHHAGHDLFDEAPHEALDLLSAETDTVLAPWTSAQTPGPATLPSPSTGHPALRSTRAFLNDVRRPRIDPEQVAADWTLMYHWLRHDPEMAAACGFTHVDLTASAEATRIVALQREIGIGGSTFEVLPNELTFWVRYAWTSADRCSGRQHALQHAVIRHLPDVVDAEQMLRAAVEHADIAMDAPLPPQTVVTVLGPPTPPGRIGQMFLTEQLMRAAGHARNGGTWSGDGGYLDLTQWVVGLDPGLVAPAAGYPEGTFDTLPMVALGRDGRLAMGTCPPASRYLVDIPWPRHPDRDDPPALPVETHAERFACWPAVPLQTNFALDIAGQRYCVIFNGWYVDEEIAANLLDPNRYAWADRVSAAIHEPAELARLRRTDRLDEYRSAQIEIATLRAVRQGFKAARKRLNSLGPSQAAFGKFHERYVAAHGVPPPNDTGWTANRFGSRYRQPSHSMPHVPQTRGAALAKHWLTFRSLRAGARPRVINLASA